MAGSELQTDFNVAPYFDDYNEDKQFYRILFRPSVAVQARELTQLQTIMQRQISRFGNSIYKDGSIIEGCNFTTYPDIPQVKFKDSNTSTVDFTLLTLNDGNVANSYLLVSNTTGVRAVVFKAFTGAESVVFSGNYDTNRAYLQYIETGSVGGVDVEKFQDNGEQIDVYHPTNQNKQGPLNQANRLGFINTLSSNAYINAYGVGYGMKVGEGVIFQKGFFQKSLPTTFIMREHFSNVAGYRVGFSTEEYVITEVTDTSLNDNAIGSYNYTAPGAHRLKLVPVPTWYDASNNAVTIPKNFLAVMEFDGGDGRIVQNNSDLQLSAIGDVIAKRTFEESGDYIVRPFNIDVISHESNNQSFYYNISSGLAYIDGYRVELLSPRRVEVKRAIDTDYALNQITTVNMGNYVRVQNFSGTIPTENLPEVQLITGDQEVLGNNQFITLPIGGLGSTWVGNASIRAVVYEPGSGRKGTPNAQFQVYLTNIRMKPGKNFLNDADSFYLNHPTYGYIFGDFMKDNTGKVIYYDTQLQNLLFDTGSIGVKRLTTNTGFNDSTLIYRKTLTGNLVKVGDESQATFTLTGPDQFNYGVGYLSDTNSEDVNVTFAQDTASVAYITNGTKALNGFNGTGANITSTTAFTSSLYVGAGLKLTNTTSGSTGYVTVRSIDGANSVYVTPVGQIPAGTFTVRQFFKQGTHVSFTGSGNTIYVSSPTSLTINLKLEPDSSAYNVNAQIPLKRTGANPIEKVVNKKSVIKINTSTHWNGTTGPWNLGLTDVFSLVNVHVGSISGTPYSDTNTDRSEWFYIDSGQADDVYNHAKLFVKPQYASGITSGTTMLVKVNHFTANITSTKAGFFSVDSYPIDDANTANAHAIATAQIPIYLDTHSLAYDLRNYIDFRPVVANTANVTTVVAAATINPANNFTVYVTGTGTGLSIEPNANFVYNIEYYLPRKDILVLNKDGSLTAKLGQPSIKPQLPSLNKSGLQIADIVVPPYPSLTFTEAE